MHGFGLVAATGMKTAANSMGPIIPSTTVFSGTLCVRGVIEIHGECLNGNHDGKRRFPTNLHQNIAFCFGLTYPTFLPLSEAALGVLLPEGLLWCCFGHLVGLHCLTVFNFHYHFDFGKSRTIPGQIQGTRQMGTQGNVLTSLPFCWKALGSNGH